MGQKAILGILAVVCLLFSASCTDQDDEGQTGELGRGTFYYQCVDDVYDLACHGSSGMPQFPSAVAVGGSFNLDYVRTEGADQITISVIGGSPNHVLYEGGTISLQTEADAALLAMTTKNRAMDLIHVTALEPNSLELVSSAWDAPQDWEIITEVTVESGSFEVVRGITRDVFGRALAGVLQFNWEVDNTAVAALEYDTNHSVVRIDGVGAGQAHLIGTAAGIVRTFDIIVTDNDTDIDGGTDTDTQSDSDSETTEDTDDTDTTDDTDEPDTETDPDSGVNPDSGIDVDGGRSIQ